MRMGRILALVVAAAVGPAGEAAASAEGGFAVKGNGAAPCSRFVEALEAKDAEFYVFAGWIEGYLTAINQFSPETYDVAPWQSTEVLTMMMNAYCRQRPNDLFSAGVNRMAQALQAERLTRPSRLFKAENGSGASVPIYEAMMLRVQEALIAKGYLPAPADGAYGRQTRLALERFQRERSLPVSGLPDQRTLHQLFPPPALPAR
jgi:hypothetical protein